jgi:peptidoglycan/LPS O-acetylase OafA/YrhL
MVRRLLYINGLATIAAVIHHSMHWILTGLFWWTDRYRAVTIPNYDELGSLSYYGLRLIDQLAFIGVPAFLFVSGFFIAIATGSDEKTVSWKIVGNRIKKLIPPYLLWSFVIILLDRLSGTAYSLPAIIKNLITGGVAPPFYYVPVLIQLLILSVFLVPLSRTRPKLLLSFAFLLQIPVTIATYISILDMGVTDTGLFFSIFRDWHLPGYIFWFVLGLVVKFHLPEAQIFLERNIRLLGFGAIITFFLGVVEWDALRVFSNREWISPQLTLIDKVFALLLLLVLISIQRPQLPLHSQLNYIGVRSYGVYLTHTLVLTLVAKMVYHLFPLLLAYPYIFGFVLVAAGLILPLIFMEMMNRSPLRRFYQYVFG